MRQKRLLAWLGLLFSLAAIAAVPAETLIGKVVGVHDGDTLTLLVNGDTEYKIRLDGIDAPELKQDFGQRSKQALSALCFGKGVRVKAAGEDRYGRTLGTVYVNGADVNRRMVADGFAWHYVKYSDSESLAKAEAAARKKKLGLWKDKSPTAPWDWRTAERQRPRRSTADDLLPKVTPDDRPPAVSRTDPPPRESGGSAAPEEETSSAPEYWLNTATGVRHNRSCRYFEDTKSGRRCGPDEGRACKKCGG